MTIQELIRENQGERTQTEFAERIGVNQYLISRALSGAPVSKKVVVALCVAYPERRREIIDAWIADERARVVA